MLNVLYALSHLIPPQLWFPLYRWGNWDLSNWPRLTSLWIGEASGIMVLMCEKTGKWGFWKANLFPKVSKWVSDSSEKRSRASGSLVWCNQSTGKTQVNEHLNNLKVKKKTPEMHRPWNGLHIFNMWMERMRGGVSSTRFKNSTGLVYSFTCARTRPTFSQSKQVWKGIIGVSQTSSVR